MQFDYVPNDFSRSYTIPILKDSKNSLSKRLIRSVFRAVAGLWTFQNKFLTVAPSCVASFGVKVSASNLEQLVHGDPVLSTAKNGANRLLIRFVLLTLLPAWTSMKYIYHKQIIDIILITPTVQSLQSMLQICERAIVLLDMSRRHLCVCDLILAIIQNAAIYVLPMAIAYRVWNRVVIWEFVCVPQYILNARLVMLRNLCIDLSIQYLVN